ncbi:E3 ubiquitin-protein ligase rnft1 [Saguinus oedipus]|uniref:RING-type E3 ubiquitin transferase n=1 Tax=Saguinus oedipus TaxID=9490 RepID=A0ABQ9VPN4_SAGOE|nr:E3 ubiquitin-protein ligase rnft1 [Saguinus oedipus]
MPFKSKPGNHLFKHLNLNINGYWYMLLEELCQYYRTFVPMPVWFRYLISYEEFGNVTTWSLGILLALLYLILKSYGVTASKRQCSDVDDICSICQAEFQKPILLICQYDQNQ